MLSGPCAVCAAAVASTIPPAAKSAAVSSSLGPLLATLAADATDPRAHELPTSEEGPPLAATAAARREPGGVVADASSDAASPRLRALTACRSSWALIRSRSAHCCCSEVTCEHFMFNSELINKPAASCTCAACVLSETVAGGNSGALCHCSFGCSTQSQPCLRQDANHRQPQTMLLMPPACVEGPHAFKDNCRLMTTSPMASPSVAAAYCHSAVVLSPAASILPPAPAAPEAQ